MKKIIFIVFFSFAFSSYSWEASPGQKFIELSINHMYNYQFDSTFYYLDLSNNLDNEHPLYPFLYTTTSWLSIQSEDGFESSYEDIRESVSKNIPIYKKLISKYPDNPEYLLYLGSLYGLEARIELAYSHWFKAFLSTRNGYKYINKAHRLDNNLDDVYLPLGLISYYTCISSPFIKFLSKIAGISVDCDNSINYLELASTSSHYSYIEASNLLSYIYLYMEGDYGKALGKIKPLTDKFPNHPFFQFIKAECLIKMGNIEEFDQNYSNLERFLNHDSEVIRNECQLKMSYLIALKHYYNKEYRQSIEYTSKVIDGYNMEFNWLLGLSYYVRANSFISIDDINNAKSDLKKVLKIDFKFPEKEKSKELLYSLSKVE